VPNYPRFRLGFLLLLLPLFGSSQEDVVFSTDLEVVNVFATVRDKSGAVVTDLERVDFLLKEDGQERKIEYFSRQSDLPLTIGLLVDTSMSQRRVLDEQRQASHRFLDRVLQDQDQAFVIGFDVETELLQDLTGSTEELRVALDRLETPILVPERRPEQYFQFPGGGGFPGGGTRGGRNPRAGAPGGRGGQRGGRGPGGASMIGVGTVLYDAVYLAADEVLADQAGRKALIIISDGADLGSKLTDREAIEAVHRVDGIIYSIYFADTRDPGRRGSGRRRPQRVDGEKVLREMSQETGGQLYKLTDDVSLNEIFDRIEEDLRSQYSIGFQARGDGPTEFREIELKARGKGLRVYSRQGYFPTAK
jgi:VWFA-related protein